MRNAILSMLIALIVMAGMPAWILPSEPELQAEGSQPKGSVHTHITADPDTLPNDSTAQGAEEDTPRQTHTSVSTVRVLKTQTGEVEEMDLDTYLYGVVFGEMPASFGKEALRAQAIASRTYTEFRIRACAHDNADLCDSAACCQNYICREEAVQAWGESIVSDAWREVVQAVDDTSGQVLIYNGMPICAVYHAASYQMTASPEEVWGGSLPYLQSVSSPEEDICADMTFTRAQMKEALAACDIFPKEGKKPIGEIARTASGRVKSVVLYGNEISGTALRSALRLKSAAFEITFGDDGVFHVTSHGSGHGVGMSQYGARALAAQGKSAEEILLHYYPGCTLCYGLTASQG